MKKILLLFFISCINLFIFSQYSQNQADTNTASQIEKIPVELWVEIASHLTNASRAREAVRNIKSLSFVNKGLNELLKSPDTQEFLSQIITKRFGISRTALRILFGDAESKRQLDDQLKYYKENALNAKALVESAVTKGNLITINYLIKNGIDFSNMNNCIGEDILFLAVKAVSHPTVKEKVIKALIDKGAMTNAQNPQGRTILAQTMDPMSNCQNTEIIKYLLDHNADPNLKSCEPVLENFEIKTVLLSPLEIAIRNSLVIGKIDIVKLLINYGADVSGLSPETLEMAKIFPELDGLISN